MTSRSRIAGFVPATWVALMIVLTSPWIAPASAQTRTEKDLLGPKEVPADAYYGVQTVRALENSERRVVIQLKDGEQAARALFASLGFRGTHEFRVFAF